MTVERRALCRCGGLAAVAVGEPARVSICHCSACKRRSGSVFSYNATWPEEQVELSGAFETFRRTGEEGYWSEDRFCPRCGSVIVYRIERRPGMVTIPVGAFADQAFPEPTVSVYGEQRHKWCVIETEVPVEEV